MRDCQAELDELFKQTTKLVRTVGAKAEVTRAAPHSVIQLPRSAPAAQSGGSERDKIMRRVAAFKAHQQRGIRDRSNTRLQC